MIHSFPLEWRQGAALAARRQIQRLPKLRRSSATISPAHEELILVILNTGERPDSANHSLVQHGSLLTGKKGKSHAKRYAMRRGLIRWQSDYDSAPGEMIVGKT
jgi:hypothetical protein